MAYNNIIGRSEEIKNLERFLRSSKSEFVAIYGRRRVGKSFLVEEVYRDKILFRAVSLWNIDGYITFRSGLEFVRWVDERY